MLPQTALLNSSEPDNRTYHPTKIFWWVILLLLGVSWLGIIGLDRDAMWYDEIYSYIYAGGQQYGPIPAGEVFTRVVQQLEHEKNPPGYYLLLHFWLTLAGSSAAAGRMLSMLFGVLSVAMVFRLGRDFAASANIQSAALVGLGAAVAVGASAYYIYYLHELRVYTLIVACTAFEVWAYLRLIQPVRGRGQSRALPIGFVLVTGASLYLHYQLMFVFAIISLYHLFMVRKTAVWWRVSLLMVAAGLLFMPWVWTLYTFSEANTVNAVVSMSAAKIVPSLLLTFSNNSVALLGLLVVFAVYRNGQRLGAIIFLVAAGVIVTLVANEVYPFINQIRYIVFLWPLLAVLVGLGVERVSRWGITPVVILGIWGLAALWTVGANDFSGYLYGIIPSWREFRGALEQHAQADDVVVYHAGNYDWIRSLELDHYLYGLPIKHQMMEYIDGKLQNDDYYNHARDFIAGQQNVWVAVSHVDPPNFRLGEFQRALAESDFRECYTVLEDESVTVQLYTHLAEVVSDMPLRFGDGIHLQLVEAIDVTDDGVATVVLGSSKAVDVPNDQYSVALHVEDAAGNLVAQADYGLPNDVRGCYKTVLNVPPGAHTLRVAVYNWQTGERLTGIDSMIGEQGDRLMVTAFTAK